LLFNLKDGNAYGHSQGHGHGNGNGCFRRFIKNIFCCL